MPRQLIVAEGMFWCVTSGGFCHLHCISPQGTVQHSWIIDEEDVSLGLASGLDKGPDGFVLTDGLERSLLQLATPDPATDVVSINRIISLRGLLRTPNALSFGSDGRCAVFSEPGDAVLLLNPSLEEPSVIHSPEQGQGLARDVHWRGGDLCVIFYGPSCIFVWPEKAPVAWDMRPLSPDIFPMFLGHDRDGLYVLGESCKNAGQWYVLGPNDVVVPIEIDESADPVGFAVFQDTLSVLTWYSDDYNLQHDLAVYNKFDGYRLLQTQVPAAV